MVQDRQPTQQWINDEKFVRRVEEITKKNPLDLAKGYAEAGSPQRAGVFLNFVPNTIASKAMKAGILAEAYAQKAKQLAEEAEEVKDAPDFPWKAYYSRRAREAQGVSEDLKAISQSA